jgi:hypothetical protein
MAALLLVSPIVIVLAASGRARAQGGDGAGKQRVAVVRLAFEGNVPEVARDLFGQRLVEGLAAARFEVMTGAMVRERLAAAGLEADSCAGGSCTGKAAHALGVAFLVFAAVTEHDKTYDIALDLVNGKSGVTIGTNRERCEICGVEEASEKVSLAASALRAGARLALDGEPLGRTPVDRELPAGVHKLEVAAEGYDELERTVTAVNGVDETLDLDLVSVPTKVPLRLLGWTALAVGVAAIVGSVWAESLAGKPLASKPSPGARSPRSSRAWAARRRRSEAFGSTWAAWARLDTTTARRSRRASASAGGSRRRPAKDAAHLPILARTRSTRLLTAASRGARAAAF